MEPPLHHQHHQHHHHHQADQESGNNNNNNNNKTGSGGYTCRQTSTRWTPTTEQIRILKEIYYNNGVRSPTADQIQKISARLRQFGKIEGKNVFYWFQNHKARERQKKRFNGTATMMMTTNTPTSSSSSPNSVMMVNDHYHHQILHHHGHHGHHGHGVTMQRHASHVNVKFDQENHMVHQNRSYPSFNNGNLNHASSGTDCGVVNASNGYMSSHIYGSMEQDYSMNYNNNVNGAYNFFDRSKPLFGLAGYNQQEDQYGGDAYVEHRRTLPLFPMHGEDGHINGGGGGGANGKYGQSDDVIDHYASLKLCLN